jgi:hypothetical protein
MTYRYVITTEKEVDVDDIGAYLSGIPELGAHEHDWDIRPDDDWGTVRCSGEAHDTFVKLLAQIEGYCVRLRTECGEEFDAVLIRAPGVIRRVDDDCNPIADREEVNVASVYVY